MDTYKLTIHDENIRALLEKEVKYNQHTKGLEIEASNENEAREIAHREFNIMRSYEAAPSMVIPEVPIENVYWDLWLNPKYTKVERQTNS